MNRKKIRDLKFIKKMIGNMFLTPFAGGNHSVDFSYQNDMLLL